MRAEATGYKTALHNRVILSVGGSTTLDVLLNVGVVTESVLVEATEPLIEHAKVEVSRVISTQEIETLPNIGRNFVDFVKLSSGVAPGRENIGGGPFAEENLSEKQEVVGLLHRAAEDAANSSAYLCVLRG